MGFVSAFATLRVASVGCKFTSETSGSMAGRSARVPCMHVSRPCVRAHSTKGGSLGAPVHSAWMHDSALPLRYFLQAQASLPIQMQFAGESSGVRLNKNATLRMCGCLPRLPAQNPSLRAQQSSRPQVRRRLCFSKVPVPSVPGFPPSAAPTALGSFWDRFSSPSGLG